MLGRLALAQWEQLPAWSAERDFRNLALGQTSLNIPYNLISHKFKSAVHTTWYSRDGSTAKLLPRISLAPEEYYQQEQPKPKKLVCYCYILGFSVC